MTLLIMASYMGNGSFFGSFRYLLTGSHLSNVVVLAFREKSGWKRSTLEMSGEAKLQLLYLAVLKKRIEARTYDYSYWDLGRI